MLDSTYRPAALPPSLHEFKPNVPPSILVKSTKGRTIGTCFRTVLHNQHLDAYMSLQECTNVCASVYTNTHTHAQVCVCIFMCTYAYIYIYIHTQTHLSIYIYIYAVTNDCTYTYVYVCVCVYVCVYTYVYIYIYTEVYMHAHTHTHRDTHLCWMMENTAAEPR